MSTVSPDATKRFNRLVRSTVIAVYILILVGGVVRSTGSGMGCPDWPRCFGNWSPPTAIDQLPADYKEQYAAIREKKNLKFARYLDAVGLSETATKLREDKSVLLEGDFDPLKSWIEYGNRLVGVVIGFFIIAVAYRSLKFRKARGAVTWLSVSTLVLVIFQGWFGSIVVSTNLTPWTITVHMFIAIAIVVMLLYLYHVTRGVSQVRPDMGMVVLTCASLLLLLIQVFFGTEVRAAVDGISAYLPRSVWLENAGVDFVIHRSFSWTVLTVNAFLWWKFRKTGELKALSMGLLVLILSSFLSGVGMAYFDVPAILQPLHLLLATLAVGVEALIIFTFLPLQKGDPTTA